MSRTFVIVVAAVLVCAGAAALVARPSPEAPPRPASQAPLPSNQALQGEWEAKGVVETAIGSPQPAGTRLTRRWFFYMRCNEGRCAPWLAREASSDVEEAPLTRRGAHLYAVFSRGTYGCGTSERGRIKRTFMIGPARPGRLTAMETVRGDFPGCGPGGEDGIWDSRLAWTIRKLSSSCPGLPGCRQG